MNHLINSTIKKVAKTAIKVQEHLETTNIIDPFLLMKCEIEVYWSQSSARGWWKGVIVDYDTKSQYYLVKYENSSKDGEDTYRETLLTTSMPKWRFKK